MAEYQRPSNKMTLRGMNLTQPGDRLPMEWAQLLKNLRCYRIGEWRQRPGLTLIAPVCGDPILFGIRLTNPQDGTFRRFLVSGDMVFVDNAAHTTFSAADTGYGFEGASGIIARPDRSPQPFVFIASAGRQQKFDVLGLPSNWGLAAPLVPPTAELGTPAYRTIDDCNATAGFVATIGAVSLQTRIGAVGISQILYDTGSTGWASVAPSTMDENWQEGMFVTTSANVETVIVESIYPAVASTTVAAIAYDNSTGPGACTIQLATPTDGLQRNSLLRLNAAENVRVLSVTEGLDGVPSFRCVTTTVIAAGHSVSGFRTFRARFTNNHTTAETLSTSYVQLAVSGAGLATLSKVTTLDLSSTDTGASRPIQDTDYIHVSLRVADFSLISEIQLQFDVDQTTNDFTKNYLFKSVRQPDLQAAYAQTSPSLTAQQQFIQRQQLDEFTRQMLETERSGLLRTQSKGGLGDLQKDRLSEINSLLGQGLLIPSGEGALGESGVGGANQWTELKIPVREFQRVGSDTSKTWKDVKAFRITVNATAAVNVGLDALWIGGSYGVDFTTGESTSPNSSGPLRGYAYCYRARNTSTGSRSNPSPPTRYEVYPEREAVQLSIATPYTDVQADVIDYFRRGGSSGDWHFLATVPSGTANFTDTLPDDIVITQPVLEVDRFKPWPVPDLPKDGLCTVVGTSMIVTSGDALNTSWVRGTPLLIDSKPYTFYTNPATSSFVELNETAPAGTNLRFEIPEPLLDGQPQPVVFGPYTGASGEFLFSVGDPKNPGYLKWTNGNDPESASDSNLLELCSPSESLQNGCVIDGVTYVWSNRRSWRILPSFAGGQSGAGSDFYSQETAMGKGMAGRWGLAVGDQMYFIAFDGVYATKGDSVENLTDESLAPLFRRDGNYTINFQISSVGVRPISFESADEKFLSLTYSKDGLFMTARDTAGNFVCWFYNFLTRGWSLDQWTPSASRMIREEARYVDSLLMGSTTGILYKVDVLATLDAGVPIACRFWSREEDFGETRAFKQLGDVMVDSQPGFNAIQAVLHYDNDTSAQAIGSLTSVLFRNRQIIDINDGDQQVIRSVALDLSWNSVTDGISYLYEWQPAALLKPEQHFKRASDWDDGGYAGPKWLQGVRLRGDTFNQPKSVRVQGDEEFSIATIEVSHNGETTKEYSWTPQVTHLMRLLGLTDRLSREMQVEWIFEPEPPLATTWHIQYTSFDGKAYQHVRDMLLAYRSEGVIPTAAITMTQKIDGVTVATYQWANSAGERVKNYQPLIARKGKLHQYIFTSSDRFSLYLRDIELRVGQWGSEGEHSIQRPFGDRSRDLGGGARV
jgi:hypothetical protein